MRRDGKVQLEARPDLGALLRESEPPARLMSWAEVERLVASAPAQRSNWLDRVLRSPAPLRYALAPFTLLFALSVALSVMPAQSEQVGMLVATELPRLWESDSSVFAEVQSLAQREFDAMDIAQGQLLLFTVPRDGRDHLVIALHGANRMQAADLMGRLNQRYPMLAALPQESREIQSSPAGSRLLQLASQVRHGVQQGQGANQVTQQVLGALHSAGLNDLDVSYEPQDDGSLLVTIEGEFAMQVSGHMQEKQPAASGGAAGTAQAGDLLRLLDGARR